MEVDIWQLPIPNWELNCPGCQYPLRGLPAHRCPECGSELDMQKLIRTWSPLRPPRFTGTERPLPDFGLACGRCGEALAGAEADACPQCDEPFTHQLALPEAKFFPIDNRLTGKLLMPIVETILVDEYIPYFTRDDKSMYDIYFGGRSAGTRVMVAREFYLDLLWTLRRAQLQAEQGAATSERGRWKCPKCGESVPGNFQVCWNCGAE